MRNLDLNKTPMAQGRQSRAPVVGSSGWGAATRKDAAPVPEPPTRRQKAVKVIRHYGGDKADALLRFIRSQGGFERIATDEQLEIFAMFVVEECRDRARWNRRNRELQAIEAAE